MFVFIICSDKKAYLFKTLLSCYLLNNQDDTGSSIWMEKRNLIMRQRIDVFLNLVSLYLARFHWEDFILDCVNHRPIDVKEKKKRNDKDHQYNVCASALT